MSKPHCRRLNLCRPKSGETSEELIYAMNTQKLWIGSSRIFTPLLTIYQNECMWPNRCTLVTCPDRHSRNNTHRNRIRRLAELINKRSAIEASLLASSKRLDDAFIMANNMLHTALEHRLHGLDRQHRQVRCVLGATTQY